ncbi:unnamed protein product [Rhizoctonia solani]|uniref:Heat shock 70 kDa protein 12A n=1 Tax=Rhizoctonia solani TaxID=456999 RepID=A0A8H2XV22_9AGAM|nr:unnamed protein product [Rhizoctonia solani]
MSVNAIQRPLYGPWEGESTIVIGIDIGTTHSGVAFAFLEQGVKQGIHHVTKWPGQELHHQQSRIPTLVWYDTNQRAVSFGAEARLHNIEEAEDNGWFLAKHFKLHLYRNEHNLNIPSLPPGVSLQQIYSDFLGYLLEHTRVFFEEHIVDGIRIWERYSPTVQIVIAHPNGWGIREQAFLRLAAVNAGLVDAAKAERNVQFVTEAEASVHFCIHHTNLGDHLQPGTNFVVCDAGGSTVDTTLYSVTSAPPVLELKEKRTSACVQAGAIFVDFEVEKFLQRSLADAGLDQVQVADYVKAGVKDFEYHAKRAFNGRTDGQSITVTGFHFNNPAIGVRRGRMTISGPVIKGFFDVCVKDIIGSIDVQLSGFNVSVGLEIVLTYVENYRSAMGHKDVQLVSHMILPLKRLQMELCYGVLRIGLQPAPHDSPMA